uniref:tRNA-uridine aminocarboxypropyltransferase n=1 Tax=Rhizophora mucronata TaxID=61149 RepID=A0A2P2K7E0_RHIMU
MRVRYPWWMPPLTRTNWLYSMLYPLHYQSLNPAKALKMAVTQSNSKRPTCGGCSKPIRFCLCTRFRNMGLENKVRVTILQHSLERKHPLNSAKIAKLGLRNVTVVTVSDVNFDARFVIQSLEPGQGQNWWESSGFDPAVEVSDTPKRKFEDTGGLSSGREDMGVGEFEAYGKCLKGESRDLDDSNGGVISVQKLDLLVSCGSVLEEKIEKCESRTNECFGGESSFDRDVPSTSNEVPLDGNDDVKHLLHAVNEPVITATIGKHGVINDLNSKWMPQIHWQRRAKFDNIFSSQVAVDALAKGFIVKKLQKRQLSRSLDLEEYEEFALWIPPGSVLLFPSEKAVGVDKLEAMHFDVKNLIVLDGTWAKARRMYEENPWLSLLPHLKLDLNKLSLYSDVRHQPKAGYLSTIESIVYALKAVGDEPEGLGNLLDVFESMVADQRRCKDERLSTISSG